MVGCREVDAEADVAGTVEPGGNEYVDGVRAQELADGGTSPSRNCRKAARRIG